MILFFGLLKKIEMDLLIENKCKMTTTMMTYDEKKFLFDCGIPDWTDTWNDILPMEIHQKIWKERNADVITDLSVRDAAWKQLCKDWDDQQAAAARWRGAEYNVCEVIPKWKKDNFKHDYDVRPDEEVPYWLRYTKKAPQRKWDKCKVPNIQVREPYRHEFIKEMKKVKLPGWVFKEARNKRWAWCDLMDFEKAYTHRELIHSKHSSINKYLNKTGYSFPDITTKQGERFRFLYATQEGERWSSDKFKISVKVFHEHINTDTDYELRWDFEWKDCSKKAEPKGVSHIDYLPGGLPVKKGQYKNRQRMANLKAEQNEKPLPFPEIEAEDQD